MKISSSLIEFTLTTTVLAGWAIACAAAFQATPFQPANPPAAAPAEVSQSATPADAAPPTLEAALERKTPSQI